MTDPHTHERDTVVVREGGTSLGTILGIVAVIVLLAAVWYFAFGPGASGATNEDGGGDSQPVPSVDVPAPTPGS